MTETSSDLTEPWISLSEGQTVVRTWID